MINTITISILVVSAIGIVLVDRECQTNGGPIESCCCLGYNNTHFNAKSPGVYTIGNFGGVKCSNTRVYCDTTTGGGGWLVVQRRKNGSVDFNRDWIDYGDGFGSLNGEFWFGLRGMHILTNQGQWELRIDYSFTNGTNSYLSYSNFRIGPATGQYPLNISGFDGITTDPFTTPRSLIEMEFTTRDRDNDLLEGTYNCAIHVNGDNSGGWWYRDCSNIIISQPSVQQVCNIPQ
ncbi:fibrinogen-like protein A [Dysidea avara]|uniref:fibrinogen-like protein A n=1 Tax=Dysidea avara TaxID=196820 RepID=UPI0033174896